MQFSKRITTIRYSIFLVFLCSGLTAHAQLNPLADSYYQNQYLSNPALAGSTNVLKVNLGLRQQWSDIPGAPKTQSLTAAYGSTGKVGLGLSVQNEETGLIKRTAAKGTYAYHLPLNDGSQKLHFGVSLGFSDDRLMSGMIEGLPNDVAISRFNERKIYLDGDFGLAYTSDRLSIQAAIPNTKIFFKKDNSETAADLATFYAAVSYKVFFPDALDGSALEPKIAFRGVNNFDHIIDAGANFTLANNALNVMAMYHSTKSTTLGLGVNVKSFGTLTAAYTSSTAELQGYTNGYFQVGVQLNFFGQKSLN